MADLHGVDFLIGHAERAALINALALVMPRIPHLFFENEEFSHYVNLLGVKNLAVARLLDPGGDLAWKLDIEMTEPVPSEKIALQLSRAPLLVARPSNEVDQYSSYLFYFQEQLLYEAFVEEQEGVLKVKKI